MKKRAFRIVTALLAVCMLMGMLPVSAFAAETDPVITEYLEPVSVGCGEEVVLSLKVSGKNLTYQWYIYSENGSNQLLSDDAVYSGTTTNTLTIQATCAQAKTYVCEVRNAAGSVSDSTYVEVAPIEDGSFTNAHTHGKKCVCGASYGEYAHIDVNGNQKCDECSAGLVPGAPEILDQPENAYIKNGEDAVFFVGIIGDNLTYQWYYYNQKLEDLDGYEGTTTSKLTVRSNYVEDQWYDCYSNGDMYHCVITNEYGSIRTVEVSYNVEHFFGDWQADKVAHWKVCPCGEYGLNGYHEDAKNDKVCDICKKKIKNVFNDVKDKDAWYYEAVLFNYQNGIFIGDDAGNFRPDDAITRGEFAMTLVRGILTDNLFEALSDKEFKEVLKEIQAESGVKEMPKLGDVKGRFYERQVRFLAAMGVITGYEDGKYRGENNITRQEMIVMMYRFLEVLGIAEADIQYDTPIGKFKDQKKVAAWAKDAVKWVAGNGLFIGDEKGRLNPMENATRAQTAQVLMRFYLGVIGEG